MNIKIKIIIIFFQSSGVLGFWGLVVNRSSNGQVDALKTDEKFEVTLTIKRVTITRNI